VYKAKDRVTGEYYALKRVKMDNEKEGVSIGSLMLIVPNHSDERDENSEKTQSSKHCEPERNSHL